MSSLLVVDDEAHVRYAFQRAFANTLEVRTASTAQEARRSFAASRPDLVLLDVRLPDASGLDVFQQLRRLDPKCLVILMTAHGTADTAIQAMKLGAYDYLLKPIDLAQLRTTVMKALEVSRLIHVPAVYPDEPATAEGVDRIIGSSPAMQEVYKAIGRVAPQGLTVLITGESGTGKELVARAIYQHSARSAGPFLALNCAAIPETLLESELFGHERGAFTGADRERIGKFEQCHGGTLFLDEIGDMSGATQAKILRLLQEQTFERLGGNRTVHADVRVIAATNQDLDQAVAAGRFRRDLYYRLKVFSIHLPPLRDRLDDLPQLTQYFLRRINRELGTDVRTVAPEVLDLFGSYAWPGNVRELQSVIRGAVLVCTGQTLLPEFLRVDWSQGIKADSGPVFDPGPCDVQQIVRELLQSGAAELYDRVLARVDRTVLAEVLRFTGGNQVQASKVLGITRGTLRAKLRSLGMAVEKTVVTNGRE